ncbi:trypsin-like serine protease [Bacteriovoracaceae bacterium]|nr:trypsin-like serine protease [Bacteriovoracaceae bacterium]
MLKTTTMLILFVQLILVGCGKEDKTIIISSSPVDNAKSFDVFKSISLVLDQDLDPAQTEIVLKTGIVGSTVPLTGIAQFDKTLILLPEKQLVENRKYTVEVSVPKVDKPSERRFESFSFVTGDNVGSGSSSGITIASNLLTKFERSKTSHQVQARSIVSTEWTLEDFENAVNVDTGRNRNERDLKEPPLMTPLARLLSVTLDITDEVSEDYDVKPYESVGKVFFKKDNGNSFVCSGSVIGKNVVLTAGHCISDGEGNWHKNWIFIPQYRGSKLKTQWHGWYMATFKDWHSNRGFGRDVGMVVVAKNSSASIGETVTPFKLVIDEFSEDTPVHALGYPADNSRYEQYDFQGDRMFETLDKVRELDNGASPPSMRINSYLTGGSSGGPWLIQESDQTQRKVIGVNSYFYDGIENEMYSPRFDAAVAYLKDFVNGK